jgi:hypothetical protein
VVSEWLGKCYFRIVTFNAEHHDVFRSAINAPTTGNTYAAFLAAAKALGASEIPVGGPLAHKLSVYLQFLGRFPAFRHRPSYGWCGRTGDGDARSNDGNSIKLVDIVDIKFAREPPCCQRLGRSVGGSIWHNSGVRDCRWRKGVAFFMTFWTRTFHSELMLRETLLYLP